MLKILVAGGLDETNNEVLPKLQSFAQLLGKEVISRGHLLLNSCRTSFDRAVAESANGAAIELGYKPADRIVSYVMAGNTPVHNFGNVRTSQLVDWELGNPRLRIPEPVEAADAVVIIGGWLG